MDPSGQYRVSPAFDLTYAPRPFGERWTTVHGTGRDVGRDDLLRLADDAGLRRQDALSVLAEVIDACEAVQAHLACWSCHNAVSRGAAEAVRVATGRLRG